LRNRYGSWGVCFTYGIWFGIKGLVAAGKNFNNSSSIRKACDFLLSKQCSSGGWGESYLSCQNKVRCFYCQVFVSFSPTPDARHLLSLMLLTFLCYNHIILFNSRFLLHIALVSIFSFVQIYSNIEGNRAHVVNTAWAMLSLIEAGQV
jgi:hypothetical protein